MKADSLLSKARAEITRHEIDRDTKGGERSMSRAVSAYNSLTGGHLTESDGNLLMCCLKLARITSPGNTEDDSYIDLAAYVALYGEAAVREAIKPSRRVVAKDE